MTKLQGVVNDTTLKKVGEMRIAINAKGGEYISLKKVTDGELVVSTLDGQPHISLSANGELLQSITIPNSTAETKFYLGSGTYTLRLINKNSLLNIGILTGDVITLNQEEWSYMPNMQIFDVRYLGGSFDVSDIRNWSKVIALVMQGSTFNGDISVFDGFDLQRVELLQTNLRGDVSAFSGTTKMETFTLAGNSYLVGDVLNAISHNNSLRLLSIQNQNTTGDLQSIKNLSALTDLLLLTRGITGDIAVLGKLPSLANLNLAYTSVVGSIESLVAAFVSNGRQSGTIDMRDVKFWENVTYQNMPMSQWVNTNIGGSLRATLTWNGSQISIVAA